MPQTIQYSNNPNSDTAFVVQDGGQKNRAVLTAEPAGTLQLSDSANVSTGYVTDEDGKKHKVNLVAQLEGDIEFSENPNSTKGYATVDGKKHRVVLTASLHGGGSAPVIDELNVTPSTSAQTITAPEGTDGYSPVNVSAVTSAIDANIVAGNIKKDVEILGVTGSYKGQTPTGTKSITANGVYDVTDFASADVQVPTTAPAHYIEKAVDANGKLINGTSVIDLTGVTDVSSHCLSSAYQGATFPANTFSDMLSLTAVSGTYACYSMFMSTQGLTSANMPSLITVSGSNACRGMFSLSGLTSINLSSLTTISGTYGCYQMFYNSKLTSINLSSLTTISGDNACYSMFDGCNLLTNIDVSNLTSITGSESCRSMLSNCALTSIGFYSLCTLTGNQCLALCVSNNRTLQTMYFSSLTPSSFGSRTNQFNTMLSACTGVTVHFPSNIQSVIGSWATVTSGFGGTNTTVLFDLPATVTLTGADTITYTRNPKYDTATALAWKVGAYGTTNFTPAYYTSGTTDPSISDTIYSDAACTTAVTTVSSIA